VDKKTGVPTFSECLLELGECARQRKTDNPVTTNNARQRKLTNEIIIIRVDHMGNKKTSRVFV